MATMRDIRRRIESVKNTQKITKAMKMVASAKLRRIQNRMLSMRPYAQHINEMVKRYAGEAIGDEHPLFEQRTVRTCGILFFAAERGLCGAFNTNLLKKFDETAAEDADADTAVLVVGQKGLRYIRKQDIELLNHYTDVYDAIEYPLAVDIAKAAVAHYVAGRIDTLQFVYSRFVNAAEQQIVAEPILPFHCEELAQLNTGPLRKVYYYEPSFEDIAQPLLEEFLAARVYHALLETASSEHAARTAAMDAATENASDMIEDLTLKLNKARQTSITMELLDIVGGAETLRS